LDQATASARLRFARSCYDHLAGRLGVAVTEALAQRRIVVPASGRRYLVTDERALRQLFGVDARVLRNGKRSFARQCLDWSERRPHVAGALGAAILHALLEREYVARLPSTRALALSAAGERWFTLRLGLGPFEPVRR
ncbi:MAG TPA: ArsR family transcriptional regulator, partial [Verrucomicrobiae bacterium]|nr:ArsR family transcriptional regulator [Verrucomicrobiae bacterium]